jgi:hypothetical protein
MCTGGLIHAEDFIASASTNLAAYVRMKHALEVDGLAERRIQLSWTSSLMLSWHSRTEWRQKPVLE